MDKLNVLVCDDDKAILELDTDTKELLVDGEPVELTETEYVIMLFLMKNMGHVFSIEQIYENVWNDIS